jgi:uncharacterized membrane protein YphA (DoxX/SURF4 family)
LNDFMIFVVVITAVVGFWVFLIAAAMSRARVRELQVRERIAMIEKGLAPAPEVDPQGFQRATAVLDHRKRRRPQRHRSAGVTLVSVGLGLMLMIGFAAEEPQKAVGIGGFVVMLGMAFIVNGMFDQRQLEVEDPMLTPPGNQPSLPSSKTD